MRTRIWTKEAYELLYTQLVRKFGKLDTWKNRSSPGGEKQLAYERFLENFAKSIEADGPRAVDWQIRHVVQACTGGGISWAPGRTMTAMNNLSAAYFAGFVGAEAFPLVEAESQQSIKNRLERAHISDDITVMEGIPEPNQVSEPESLTDQ